MVVRVVAVFVSAMGRHEFDNLQRAFCAVDVRDFDVGFLFLVERGDVLEQAVGQNWRRRRILDCSRNGARAVGRGSVLASGSFGSSSREFTASATR